MAESYMIKKQNMSGVKILKDVNLSNKNLTITGIPIAPRLIFVVCSYSNIENEKIQVAALKSFYLDCAEYLDYIEKSKYYRWIGVTTFSKAYGFVQKAKIENELGELVDMPSDYANTVNMVYTRETGTIVIGDSSPYSIPAKSLYDVYVFY